MKHLHVDSVGGASGDMILGALFDLGVPPDAVRGPLETLGLGPFTIEAGPATDRGIRGTRVRVLLPGGAPADAAPGPARADPESAPHGHGGHSHAGHAAAPAGHSPHRGLAEIRALIGAGPLPDAVKADSLRVFQRLAEAEGRVHGKPPDQVHFHEVGAVDAIVDIVGACLARHWLGIDTVSVAPLPLGHGTVTCAHGVLPVPAPATVELLSGWAVQPDDEPFELVTPTGAALLSAWRTDEAPPAGARLARAGHGLGHRALRRRPNLLRALLLEADPDPAAAPEDCWVLESNVDDMTPEVAGALIPRLLAAGALDAFLTPIHMKKQRPGILVSALCRPEQRDRLRDVLFRESPTFGVREYAVRRTVLERRHETVNTPYGRIRLKIGRWRGRDVTASPEYEDCCRAAEQAGAPLRAVYEAALRACPERSGPGVQSDTAPSNA